MFKNGAFHIWTVFIGNHVITKGYYPYIRVFPGYVWKNTCANTYNIFNG